LRRGLNKAKKDDRYLTDAASLKALLNAQFKSCKSERLLSPKAINPKVLNLKVLSLKTLALKNPKKSNNPDQRWLQDGIRLS
jgi:hypothetical protein